MLYHCHEDVRCRMNAIGGIRAELHRENNRTGKLKKECAIVDKEYRALLDIYNLSDIALKKNPVEIPRFEDGKGRFAKKVRDWMHRPILLGAFARYGKIGFLNPI